MEKKSLHLDSAWLRQKYIEEGLSTYDIAAIVGRDPKRIYEKLRDFGIPTRPRGENLRGSDNYMSREGVKNPFSGRRHSEKTKQRLREIASRPKPHLRGKGNGMFGRTGDKNPRFVDGSSPERQRLYASAAWKELIRTVYGRDEYRCVRCGAVHAGKSKLCAHHIRPWAGNPILRFDPHNLVTLCQRCHRWVHSKLNKHGDFLS